MCVLTPYTKVKTLKIVQDQKDINIIYELTHTSLQQQIQEVGPCKFPHLGHHKKKGNFYPINREATGEMQPWQRRVEQW